MDTESRRVVWISVSALPAFAWPLDPPRPESVDEVAAWGDADSFVHSGYFRPEFFWAIGAVLAAGVLGWHVVEADVMREDAAWFFPAAIAFLLVLAVVWIVRVRRPLRVGEDAHRIFDTGVLCAVRRCSSDSGDSDSGMAETFIVLDHRMGDRRAWRTFRALDAWADRITSADLDNRIVSSEELFGPDKRGGWFISSGVGLGAFATQGEQRWVIVTDLGEASPHVTTVPYAETRADIRARLRRRDARPRRS